MNILVCVKRVPITGGKIVLTVSAGGEAIVTAADESRSTGVVHHVDGGLMPGETYADAAKRELWEETGLMDAVFGPVVNQGSRIEGMTRMFDVGICIDETTANFVRRLMPPDEGRVRIRVMAYAASVPEMRPNRITSCDVPAGRSSRSMSARASPVPVASVWATIVATV